MVPSKLPTMREIQKAAILDRLKHFKGDRELTADSLGISYNTVMSRLAQWKMRTVRPRRVKKCPTRRRRNSRR